MDVIREFAYSNNYEFEELFLPESMNYTKRDVTREEALEFFESNYFDRYKLKEFYKYWTK